jgi:dihydrofolate reductase
MTKVLTQASVSLDGYISKPDNTIGMLFDWLQNGDVEITSPAGDIVLRLTPASADHWRGFMSQLGALIVGRTLFDLVDGWNGRHTLDVPVVVVTHRIPAGWVEAHPDAPFTFVTDGIEAAVEHAKALAGDLSVFASAGTVASQCLTLGLLDEVFLDLVPVVMGQGRPFFTGMCPHDLPLGDPTTCVRGHHVTHLAFPVIRGT